MNQVETGAYEMPSDDPMKRLFFIPDREADRAVEWPCVPRIGSTHTIDGRTCQVQRRRVDRAGDNCTVTVWYGDEADVGEHDGRTGLMFYGDEAATKWPEGSAVLVRETMESGQEYFTADNYWRPGWINRLGYGSRRKFALLRRGFE